MIAVGLMSGTSLDGIDVAAVGIEPRGAGYDLRLMRFETVAFEPELQDRLRALTSPYVGRPLQDGEAMRALCELDADLGAAFGTAAARVAEGLRVDYAASHGQTIYHVGRRSGCGATLQIGDAFAIRERLGATVAYDFRRADCAAGGEGAPLIPYVDALLLRVPGSRRVALNLGGIANVTLLPADDGEIGAFDVGPGNVLLDELARTRAGHPYDEGGEAAARGRADDAIVERVLADPWFSAPAPKSTGRERFAAEIFDAAWLRLPYEDAQASAVEITARAIAGALARAGYARVPIVGSGGGMRNRTLIAAIARHHGGEVRSSADAGIDPDAKEAIGFAVLGYELLRGRPAGLAHVTGAAGPRLLGALAPHDLEALLARVRAEERLA